MSGDPAREGALSIAQRVAAGARLSDAIDRLLARRPMAREQSAALTSLAYGVFRHLPAVDVALASRLKRPDDLPEVVRWSLRLGAYERLYTHQPDYAVVNAWVDVAKRTYPELGGLVNAVLKRLEVPEDLVDFDAKHQPEWLLGALTSAYQHKAGEVLASLLQPSSFWCTGYGDAEAAMQREGFTFKAGPVPSSYAIRPNRSLAETKAYLAGHLQPQNPASLEVARIAAEHAKHGSVLDVCSGHGIKAAYLASLGLQVESVELDPRKIRRAKANQKRLGVNVKHLQADATRPLPQVERVHSVLVDAPCTSVGTLRRHPEIRLRYEGDRLDSTAQTQSRIVSQAAKHVAKGGVLVYAVCSFLPQEGPGVIEAFLQDNPDFTNTEFVTGLPWSPASVGGYIQPLDGLDAFYIAVLTRNDT